MVATIKQICYSEIEQLKQIMHTGRSPEKEGSYEEYRFSTYERQALQRLQSRGSGRPPFNLTTPVDEAVGIVGRNIAAIVAATEDRSEVTLTGPMAVWAYLVVFHAVVHAFARVYYDDGRGNKVLVAAHG